MLQSDTAVAHGTALWVQKTGICRLAGVLKQRLQRRDYGPGAWPHRGPDRPF